MADETWFYIYWFGVLSAICAILVWRTHVASTIAATRELLFDAFRLSLNLFCALQLNLRRSSGFS
jgi:hypothetical protein